MKHIVEYVFKPVKAYWFTKPLIDLLWRSRGVVEATFDLGLTWREIRVYDGYLVIDGYKIYLEEVTPSEPDRVVVYRRDTGKIYEVIRRSNGNYYKLKTTGIDKAPTVEINGIHMHRIVGVDPWSDSRIKARTAKVRKGDRVLDTCMGLGYTAIHSYLRGARIIYTVEIDPNIIWIAEHNPWSHGLSNNGITIIQGNIIDVIQYFEENYFDKIIHDPPRFSTRTGDLYGLDLYKEFYRVLKPGGILYHYTGEPRRHGSPSIVKGIGERLRLAGFHPVVYRVKAQGYIAYKSIY
ncbi:methyltransferase-like protein [Staphylothermus marinus F1]|uniref:Methyltransferase-like protein n=1 Tax=Staphylothermus marinus (strain ATCC 43588 / DSM 3639 / JCM 9404 / F1) TaxID=399550 RepID=A3DLG9_STAMF|nr:methyltransferase domain-containing protein [Staphylothermus marinus]ABN69479.1 methyltransferase-like protein [Staphylothermus marinus F1]